MAYDEGSAQILQDALLDVNGVVEKRMFGGLCFMLNGNMLCGVHKGGGMFRIGKENEAAALAVDGASELGFTGKKMGGMVEVTDECVADDERRQELLRLALDFVGNLPAK